MTQDAWEMLYQQVLRVTGPYHIIFFIAAIFLGSIYLVNLILAIVAMSYDDLQKKANDDAEAKAAEEAEYQESQRQMEEDMADARMERAAVREATFHATQAQATFEANKLRQESITTELNQPPLIGINNLITAINTNQQPPPSSPPVNPIGDDPDQTNFDQINNSNNNKQVKNRKVSGLNPLFYIKF